MLKELMNKNISDTQHNKNKNNIMSINENIIVISLGLTNVNKDKVSVSLSNKGTVQFLNVYTNDSISYIIGEDESSTRDVNDYLYKIYKDVLYIAIEYKSNTSKINLRYSDIFEDLV